MSRQSTITLEQVSCKVDEAKRRAGDAMRRSAEAKSAGEYNDALRDLRKAVEDHHAWGVVRQALTRKAA